MGVTGRADNQTDATGTDPAPETESVTLSWQETELVRALKRLANARSQLASLEVEAAEAAKAPKVTPADRVALAENKTQLDAAQVKATSRFGKGGARRRVQELEVAQRTILDRLGFASYDAYAEWKAHESSTPTVDLVLLDFARREVSSATTALNELQLLVIPEVEAPVDAPSEAVTEPERATGTVHPLAHPEAS